MRESVFAAIAETGGFLRLDPALVARDWLPPGRRLGLSEDQYDLGERGFVCERWLASTTHADNRIGPDDEGISAIRTSDGARLSLKDAVEVAPELIMGTAYASSHSGLGRLAKIFDYGARIPYHIHPPADQAALVGRHSKDEAYYFPPDVDMGDHPETFFGVHPWIAEGEGPEVLLPIWRSGRTMPFSSTPSPTCRSRRKASSSIRGFCTPRARRSRWSSRRTPTRCRSSTRSTRAPSSARTSSTRTSRTSTERTSRRRRCCDGSTGRATATLASMRTACSFRRRSGQRRGSMRRGSSTARTSSAGNVFAWPSERGS